MKKLLTMMLALFMVVGMTGCGSTPADQTDNNEQGNENTADVIIIGAGGAGLSAAITAAVAADFAENNLFLLII